MSALERFAPGESASVLSLCASLGPAVAAGIARLGAMGVLERIRGPELCHTIRTDAPPADSVSPRGEFG
jgi:hypothetical protein